MISEVSESILNRRRYLSQMPLLLHCTGRIEQPKIALWK
jgi:hypothetical protein